MPGLLFPRQCFYANAPKGALFHTERLGRADVYQRHHHCNINHRERQNGQRKGKAAHVYLQAQKAQKIHAPVHHIEHGVFHPHAFRVLGFSSGMIRKIAHFSRQNFSASISVSKHRSCSSSESKKAFSLDRAVLMTLAIDCSAVFRAAPANHFALWSSGRSSMSCWN